MHQSRSSSFSGARLAVFKKLCEDWFFFTDSQQGFNFRLGLLGLGLVLAYKKMHQTWMKRPGVSYNYLSLWCTFYFSLRPHSCSYDRANSCWHYLVCAVRVIPCLSFTCFINVAEDENPWLTWELYQIRHRSVMTYVGGTNLIRGRNRVVVIVAGICHSSIYLSHRIWHINKR